MKKMATISLVMALLLLLVSCVERVSINDKDILTEEIDVRNDCFDVHADWEIYRDFDTMLEKSDCVILGKIMSQDSALSVGYQRDDFINYENILDDNSREATYMQLSIRTPYTVEVKEIYYTNGEKTIGEHIELYQIGGTYEGITLTDSEAKPFSVGAEYILFLKKEYFGDIIFYQMVNPIQGYAQVIYNTDLSNVTFLTNEINPLFNDVSSLDYLRRFAVLLTEK
jgi:hypothetical protein